MNPVLLKPETDVGAQVIVQGKRIATARARDYAAMKPSADGARCWRASSGCRRAPISCSWRAPAARPRSTCATPTSPIWALRASRRRAGRAGRRHRPRRRHRAARRHQDGDRPGRCRDDRRALSSTSSAAIPTLFDDGYTLIEEQTGWRGFGVLPWFARAGELPAEDALGLSDARKPAANARSPVSRCRGSPISTISIRCELEPGVDLVMVRPGEAIPGDAALVIMPGSKSTRGDLAFLRAQGWDIDLLAHHRSGGHVLGLCGGYQMLGRSVADPDGHRGPRRRHGGSRPSGCRDGDEPAEDADACRGRACRDGSADRGLRNPHRPHRWAGSRAAIRKAERRTGRRDLARRTRARQLSARPVHVG